MRLTPNAMFYEGDHKLNSYLFISYIVIFMILEPSSSCLNNFSPFSSSYRSIRYHLECIQMAKKKKKKKMEKNLEEEREMSCVA
ncbi:Hypothetical predicted protein [Octopus vulgaris]|uniref:Uncharacterized protein n=1 Tax=Octopus vulgaris TaxID=6645 RepID=A0AA36BGD2_OCTVU|nr:Hypothetical predicted protein [Octopus vulgaris]